MTEVARSATGALQCVSCGATLTGPYCARCGEHAADADALTLRHFLSHTVAHELFHLDGALWRSVRLLLTRPGGLSLEFSAGRRRPFVNPFRLLLVSIVIYALATSGGFNVFWNIGGVTASIAPASIRQGSSVENTIAQIDHYGLLTRQFEAKRDRVERESVREKFHDRLEMFAEPASFANVLLFAAALHLCFRKRRFLEDTAFAMHVLSFVLLSSVTLVAAYFVRKWMGGFFFQFIVLIGLWQFVYLALAIRRFYLFEAGWSRWPLSISAALLLYILNSVFMTGVQVAGAAIALAMT